MTTWRDIQKNSKRAGKTRSARKRKLNILFRTTIALLVALSIGTGIAGLVYFKKDINSRKVFRTDSPVAKVQFQFETDGVLTRDWANNQFGEFLQTDVRMLDLNQVKQMVEELGQVKEARVQIQLPNTLLVAIQERDPVLRVRVRDSETGAKTLLIARDGTVYEGMFYPKESLKRLPGAIGLTLKKDAGQWLPVTGMTAIADFLDEARFKVPSLYRHWKVIDLSKWSADYGLNSDLIEVSSGSRSEIVFSLNQFPQQLTRLAQIVNHSQRYQMGFPKKIDLSYGEEAVINY